MTDVQKAYVESIEAWKKGMKAGIAYSYSQMQNFREQITRLELLFKLEELQVKSNQRLLEAQDRLMEEYVKENGS